MEYILVHTPNLQTFISACEPLLAEGYVFDGDYIERITDNNIDLAGGWGCVRFSSPPAANKLFEPPCTEYRYSKDTETWVNTNGEPITTPELLSAFYKYFVANMEKNYP